MMMKKREKRKKKANKWENKGEWSKWRNKRLETCIKSRNENEQTNECKRQLMNIAADAS
jgi:hypothetical protein